MTYTKEFEIFDAARRYWSGVKRGGQTEFDNFRKKHKDWKETVHLLKPAIKEQEQRRIKMAKKGEFVPPRKHFQTWINQRCWEETKGQEFTSEELTAKVRESKEKQKRGLEKKRQEKRETYKVWYDWPDDKLKAMRKDKYWLPIWWLIDEILDERNRQKDKLGIR